MEKDTLKWVQRVYWTVAKTIFPYTHTIIAITLIISMLGIAALTIIIVAAYEIQRGNYNFVADWKDWFVSFWQTYLEPYWDIIKIIVALSLPVIVFLLICASTFLIAGLWLFYAVAFPKASTFYIKPGGRECPGGFNGRLFWSSDAKHWTNWVAALPEKAFWKIAGQEYEEPEWTTKSTGVREYDFISGPGRYIRNLIAGFSADMERWVVPESYECSRSGLWRVDIRRDRAIKSTGAGNVTTSDMMPESTEIPIRRIEETTKKMMIASIGKTQLATKVKPTIAEAQELWGVVYKLSDAEIERMMAEREDEGFIKELTIAIRGMR